MRWLPPSRPSVLILLRWPLAARCRRSPTKSCPIPARGARAERFPPGCAAWSARTSRSTIPTPSSPRICAVLVRERLKAGDSDDQIRAFLVQRYGDFILLKPPFEWGTLLLWLGPALVLVVGAGASLMAARRKSAEAGGGPGGTLRNGETEACRHSRARRPLAWLLSGRRSSLAVGCGGSRGGPACFRAGWNRPADRNRAKSKCWKVFAADKVRNFSGTRRQIKKNSSRSHRRVSLSLPILRVDKPARTTDADRDNGGHSWLFRRTIFRPPVRTIRSGNGRCE